MYAEPHAFYKTLIRTLCSRQKEKPYWINVARADYILCLYWKIYNWNLTYSVFILLHFTLHINRFVCLFVCLFFKANKVTVYSNSTYHKFPVDVREAGQQMYQICVRSRGEELRRGLGLLNQLVNWFYSHESTTNKREVRLSQCHTLYMLKKKKQKTCSLLMSTHTRTGHVTLLYVS